MHNEFTAVIERDGKWFVAWCPEIPEANGQGHTAIEAREDLSKAISLVLEDRREDALRGVPTDAQREVVVIAGSGKTSYVTSVRMGVISSAKAALTLFGSRHNRSNAGSASAH